MKCEITKYLHQIVSRTARKHPRHIAIIEAERSITYGELYDKIHILSDNLMNSGLKKKERVGILSRNSINSIALYFAISRAGGVVVPLDFTADPLDIIKHLKDCSASAIYIGKGLKAKAKSVIKKAKSVRFIIDDVGGETKAPKELPKIKQDDLAAIVYTAGTTRRPLGVMLSHKNLLSNSRSVVKYLRLTPSDKVCCVLPFHYIYGMSLLLSHFLAGAAVILENRFMYPNLVLDTIEKRRATGFAGVSSHYAILVYRSDLYKRKLPSIKHFMQAGDSMPTAITKKLLKLFPNKKLYLMYGQTEAGPRLTYLNPRLTKKKPASVGKAIPGVEVKLLDEKGRECVPQQEGEIVVKGDNVMLGYWQNKSETKKVLKDKWLYTGDIGYKDKDGDLYIAGRRKEFLKIGGRKVNPHEIEAVAAECDGVMEAIAIGVRDPILGNRIKLFVAPFPKEKIAKEEILKFCKRKLPTHKVPSEIVTLTSIPKNSSGKLISHFKG